MLSFGKLLELDRSVPMYIKNLQVLPPKMFKINIIQAPPTAFSTAFLNHKIQGVTCKNPQIFQFHMLAIILTSFSIWEPKKRFGTN